MNKQIISKFSILFVSLYVALFSTGFLFYKSGFSNYNKTTTEYTKNNMYLVERMENGQNHMAFLLRGSNTGQVDAFGGVLSNLAFITIPAGVRFASIVYPAITNNNLGWNLLNIHSLAEGFIPSVLLGGSISDCADAWRLGQDTDQCEISKALLNQQIYDEDNGLEPLPDGQSYSGGGLLGFSNNVFEIAYVEQDQMLSTSLFSNSIAGQIPLVGSSVQAAIPVSVAQSFVFQETFFTLWKTVRNWSYYLIIIPTIAFGFAIMFRVQVGPQTQVTLMQAIPRLLVVILLITFSYPLFSLIFELAKPVANLGIDLLELFAKDLRDARIASYNSFLLATLYWYHQYLKHIAFVIFFIIMLVGYVIAFYRYLFTVVVTMLKVAFLVAFSPFFILIGAFPGKEDFLKNFLINVISNIFGLSLLAILWHASFVVFGMGYTIAGPNATFALIQPIFAFAAFALLWKAPTAPKILSQAMGAQPLFASGDPRKR